MDIGKFIDKYVKSSSEKVKDALVAEHIVATYIPYETKMAEAKNIIENSAFQKVDNKRRFWMNTPMRYVLFIKDVITCYTDLEWDMQNVLIQFNLLEQYGITEKIIATIGPDFEKFQTVLNMTLDDAMTNERTLLSYFENMETTIESVADQIVAAMPEILEEFNKA